METRSGKLEIPMKAGNAIWFDGGGGTLFNNVLYKFQRYGSERRSGKGNRILWCGGGESKVVN